jgi:putative glutamine amidotransferase
MRPKIAVLMDENTSSGGTRYEAHKGYFHSIVAAGGMPYGVPYAPELVGEVVQGFDGLLTAGGRFAVPAEWYVAEAEPGVATDRLAVEIRLLQGFLARRKAVLGMCAGMQTLACLHGGRMTPSVPGHDQRGLLHEVEVVPGTQLFELVGARLEVNTFHREALAHLGEGVVASGRTVDGVIEAIEVTGQPFAIGIQWHQELHDLAHPGQAIFERFVEAASKARV